MLNVTNSSVVKRSMSNGVTLNKPEDEASYKITAVSTAFENRMQNMRFLLQLD